MLLVLWLTPDSFLDFTSEKEDAIFAQQISQNASQKNAIDIGVSQLVDYRVDIVKSDILRSLQFILGLFLLIGLYLYNKVNRNLFIMLVGVLVLVDLWTIDKRYFNNEEVAGAGRNASNKYEKYELPETNSSPYQASAVDNAILQREISLNPQISQTINERVASEKREKRRLTRLESEKIQFTTLMRNTHYRVLNTASRLDEDAGTAYFHKTLGGYHAAKMKKYQELIDFRLGQEHFQLRQAFAQGGADLVRRYLPQMYITNMLNAKYVIGAVNTQQGQQLTYLENQYAYGNVWFVDSVRTVESANDEMMTLLNVNPRRTTVMQSSEDASVKTVYNTNPSADRITLVSYLPNVMKYKYQTSKEQFAVFSEVFYKDGWKVFVNGEEDKFFKVNYILRGMKVPAGSGEIEFRFEPSSYKTGEIISLISSLIIVLLTIGAIVYATKNKEPKEVFESE